MAPALSVLDIKGRRTNAFWTEIVGQHVLGMYFLKENNGSDDTLCPKTMVRARRLLAMLDVSAICFLKEN